MQYIKLLSELGKADLQEAGGKAANLGALLNAGFPVPEGFCITTLAYIDFVSENSLHVQIQRYLEDVRIEDPESLENASVHIRSAFESAVFPASISGDILAAYSRLNPNSSIEGFKLPVAVRSSATAEDLPGLSFAGQQDTYLNIQDEQSLLEAVICCWSSLWTARAIGYRRRNKISQEKLAQAVIIQKMIQSQASGVLFTANPLSGKRNETVIDATIGLGEALVSGQAEPDHYVIDTDNSKIAGKSLGAKAVSIHGREGGGTQLIQETRSEIQALPDEQILALASLGRRVEKLFAFPQDIEWAWADGKLTLLQSRPITSLFPIPANLPAEPLKVLFSFAAVQGISDPLTPLGRYALRQIFAVGAGLFGIHVTAETQSVLYEAGERLWVNFTALLKNSTGRRFVPYLLNMVEPSILQAVKQIWDAPQLTPDQPGIRFQSRLKIARLAGPMVLNVLLNLAAPRKRREFIVNNGERLLALMEARSAAIEGDDWQKLAQRAGSLADMADQYLPHTLILFVSGVASGMVSWNFLRMLSRPALANDSIAEQKNNDLMMLVTRSMPYNPTTEMDLVLWEMAKKIRTDPLSKQVFFEHDPTELAKRYQSGNLPQLVCQEIDRFLVKYGGRGLGEIDLGRNRWAEDPTHVFEMLSSFLSIEDERQAPDLVFASGAGAAQEAVNQLAETVRRTRFGWFKAHLIRFSGSRARQLMGIRESPKFFAVRMMYIIHRELLKSGQELTALGELNQPDDLFYLTFEEIQAMAAHKHNDRRDVITNRRANYERELMRRQIPRLLLSDGRAFYEGLEPSRDNALNITGSPVSPGKAQGNVRVVLDPRQAHLQPGEILVCPGTDPSWTPLFLSAAGLIMETGGMMTHGAVVAREYGIPAIVGVDRATQRLQTGQLIRLDGSSGIIELLDPSFAKKETASSLPESA